VPAPPLQGYGVLRKVAGRPGTPPGVSRAAQNVGGFAGGQVGRGLRRRPVRPAVPRELGAHSRRAGGAVGSGVEPHLNAIDGGTRGDGDIVIVVVVLVFAAVGARGVGVGAAVDVEGDLRCELRYPAKFLVSKALYRCFRAVYLLQDNRPPSYCVKDCTYSFWAICFVTSKCSVMAICSYAN